MAKQKIYPADTVDSEGKVWPTLGENIRKGSKEIAGLADLLDSYVLNLLNELYPVNSIIIGQIPKLLTEKFVWEPGFPKNKQSALRADSLNSNNNGCVLSIPDSTSATVGRTTFFTVPMLSHDATTALYDLIGITEKSYGSYTIPFFHRVR